MAVHHFEVGLITVAVVTYRATVSFTVGYIVAHVFSRTIIDKAIANPFNTPMV